ncbi:hypothetical protein JST99_01645 [Candidatus Dependentiae bacterium]|nr:hypothetical protein [Candidatus Dependentiae bacterium]MCC7414798.1 hypothetical protein [Campylobacterota bacterium]
MKCFRMVWNLLSLTCLTGFMHAVDLRISNTSNRSIWATARNEASVTDLVHVAPGARRVFVENITPNDTLTMYFDGGARVWGVYRIVLGGQRNDPIDLTFAGNACENFELQDILGEPGEGGYNLQDLYEKRPLEKRCPIG